MSALATFEGTHVMQEPEQFQAALVRVLASVQDGAHQAVDALGQHTPSPRASQHLADRFPGKPDRFCAQEFDRFIQAARPQHLPSPFLGPRQRVTPFIGFDLPDVRDRARTDGASQHSMCGASACLKDDG